MHAVCSILRLYVWATIASWLLFKTVSCKLFDEPCRYQGVRRTRACNIRSLLAIPLSVCLVFSCSFITHSACFSLFLQLDFVFGALVYSCYYYFSIAPMFQVLMNTQSNQCWIHHWSSIPFTTSNGWEKKSEKKIVSKRNPLVHHEQQCNINT